jgi:hypothetical protein
VRENFLLGSLQMEGTTVVKQDYHVAHGDASPSSSIE